MRTWRCAATVLVAVSMATSGCTENEHCDAASLEGALDDAVAGDTVQIGACRIVGTFVVPSGVTLHGAGRGQSTLVVDGEGPALKLMAGERAALAQDLSIESDGRIALRVMAGEAAGVERVDVVATLGVGLGAEDVSSLTLSEVSLNGPVDAENDGDVPYPVALEESATYGLVLVRVGDASLTDVTVSGFASFGAQLVESATTWHGGGAPANLGTGLMVHGGSATLEGVDLSGTLQGFRGMPAYAGVFTGGASIVTDAVTANGSEGLGLMHDDVTARHRGLTAVGNYEAGVWAQHCTTFELSGSGSTVSDNGFAGVVLVDSSDVTIADARVDASAAMVSTVGQWGAIEVGDGLHIVEPVGPITLRDLSLSGNERVGLLVDLQGGSTDTLFIEGVVVSGSSGQLGALAQDGDVVEGWDASVTREDATLANDAAFEGTLETVTAVASDGTEFPDTPVTLDQGIAGIIGDCC